MKFAEKVLAFVGCLALGVFLSCASSVKQRTAQSEKKSVQPNFEQIAEAGKAATVHIGSLSVETPPALGSGFFIRHDLIVTNIHVVCQKSFDGAVSVVKLVNKPTWYTVKGVMASDPKWDLVILKVAKVSGEDPQILSLGDSDTVKAGDNIIVIGNPGQDGKVLQGDVSVGWVSRITPNFLDLRARNIYKGYSGGPVLNVHKEVIGIMFEAHRVGAGYAIPSNYLQALLKDIPTQAKPLEKWREEPLVRYYSALDAADRGEFTSAIKGYDNTINLAPDFANVYINRGAARQKIGYLEGAIKDYDMAIRLGEDYAYVYFNRGLAKSDLGDNKGAIKDYDTAIRLDPAYVSAYVNRGLAKSGLEDKQGAIEDYDTAIRLEPEDTILVALHLNRGLAKSDLGDNKGAIEDCNTAIGLKPKSPVLAAATYNARGKAKSAQGDNKESIIDYDKAIELKPRAQFYYNRGIANTALGRTSVAETDLKTALKLLDQARSTSKSVDKETTDANWEFTLNVPPDLKADIEEALRDLE